MTDIMDTLDDSILAEFSDTELEAGMDPDTGNWEVIVKYHGNILRVEAELGAEVEILNQNFAIITLPQNRIDDLYNFFEIEYIELPKYLTCGLARSMDSACITPVQSESGFGLTGRGTIIAILDSGIDYTHPDFRNADGSTRILFFWDQTAQGVPPAGFKSGTEDSSAQINAALASGLSYRELPPGDIIGHGTAVAGTAAGNGRSSGGRERGAAPEASIIPVRLGNRGRESFARTTELMRAVKYVFDKARLMMMPLSVNISYGTNDGSHAGNSLFESYISDMSQEWKASIVVASGNEGAAGHHFSTAVRQSETVTAEFSISDNLNGLFLAIWKNFVDTLTFELIAPNGMSSGIVSSADRDVVMHFGNIVVLIHYGQPTPYSADHEIFIQFKANTGFVPAGLWNVLVHGVNVVDGTVDMWLPTLEEVTDGTSFLRPGTQATLTLPSTAHGVLTVGGYNASIDSLTAFSGLGYTRKNIYVKPDLVAPAVNILSTSTGGGYGTFTGTSIAAPFVTGSAALMMQWGIVDGNDPFLFAERIKAMLHRGARRIPGVTYPNPIWGYGALCLETTMDYLVNSI